MGQNKEQLNKLLDFIDQLAKDKDNAWFVKRLREKYGLSYDGRIDDIYEYCIEQVIQDQAEQFYKDFPIRELVPGLQEDFIQMEFCHRRNSFVDFSIAVYQQIERITNKVCSINKLNEAVAKLMGHPAYVTSVQQSDGSWKDVAVSDRSKTSSYQIAKLLFGKSAPEKSLSNLSAQWAVDKIYCILYFLCYQAKLKSQEYNQFVEYKKIYNAIYQFRNLNHRGSVLKDEQKEIIDNIMTQKGVYYFKFMQALLFYVEGVAKGLSSLDELYNYSQSEKKINVIALNVLRKIELPEKDKKRIK